MALLKMPDTVELQSLKLNSCFALGFLKFFAVKHFSVFQGKKMTSTLDEFVTSKKGSTLQ